MAKEEKKEIIELGKGKNKLIAKAFIIETTHPAIGKFIEVEGKKFVFDNEYSIPHEGNFIRPFTERDQELIDEYDEALEKLSEKLLDKVDLKRFIMENLKDKPISDIKTGLYIIQKEEEGEEVEKTHRGGCYDFCMQYKSLQFNLITGSEFYEPDRRVG